MLSQFTTDIRRWAMMMRETFLKCSLSISITKESVIKSMFEVASSNTRILAFSFRSTRQRQKSCFCPAENCVPEAIAVKPIYLTTSVNLTFSKYSIVYFKALPKVDKICSSVYKCFGSKLSLIVTDKIGAF